MSDDAGFVQAIRHNPDDAALRRVYADWLDERGDPRGEYLRLQCQLADLSARLAQLGEQFDPTWLASVREDRDRGSQLRLQSGRTIYLRSLRQQVTYGGLLEGFPTRQMNQDIIEGILSSERRRDAGDPYLIPPVQRPLEYPRARPYPFGEPVALPPVSCVARFTSLEPARDKAMDGSELVVVWFQGEFALPVDRQVVQQLLAIDWNQHAFDFDY